MALVQCWDCGKIDKATNIVDVDEDGYSLCEDCVDNAVKTTLRLMTSRDVASPEASPSNPVTTQKLS